MDFRQSDQSTNIDECVIHSLLSEIIEKIEVADTHQYFIHSQPEYRIERKRHVEGGKFAAMKRAREDSKEPVNVTNDGEDDKVDEDIDEAHEDEEDEAQEDEEEEAQEDEEEEAQEDEKEEAQEVPVPREPLSIYKYRVITWKQLVSYQLKGQVLRPVTKMRYEKFLKLPMEDHFNGVTTNVGLLIWVTRGDGLKGLIVEGNVRTKFAFEHIDVDELMNTPINVKFAEIDTELFERLWNLGVSFQDPQFFDRVAPVTQDLEVIRLKCKTHILYEKTLESSEFSEQDKVELFVQAKVLVPNEELFSQKRLEKAVKLIPKTIVPKEYHSLLHLTLAGPNTALAALEAAKHGILVPKREHCSINMFWLSTHENKDDSVAQLIREEVTNVKATGKKTTAEQWKVLLQQLKTPIHQGEEEGADDVDIPDGRREQIVRRRSGPTTRKQYLTVKFFDEKVAHERVVITAASLNAAEKTEIITSDKTLLFPLHSIAESHKDIESIISNSYASVLVSTAEITQKRIYETARSLFEPHIYSTVQKSGTSAGSRLCIWNKPIETDFSRLEETLVQLAEEGSIEKVLEVSIV